MVAEGTGPPSPNKTIQWLCIANHYVLNSLWLTCGYEDLALHWTITNPNSLVPALFQISGSFGLVKQMDGQLIADL